MYDNVTKELNNAKLEALEPLTGKDLEIFKKYK